MLSRSHVRWLRRLKQKRCAQVGTMLVAKDQAFHLDGNPELRNPTITLQRGQIAELVLRNDDPSRVLHCLSIAVWVLTRLASTPAKH